MKFKRGDFARNTETGEVFKVFAYEENVPTIGSIIQRWPKNGRQEVRDMFSGEHFERASAHDLMLWKRKQREAALDGQSVSGRHDGTLNKRALAAMRRVHPKNDEEAG